MVDIPDFPPMTGTKDDDGFPKIGGTAFDMYLNETMVVSTVVTDESPSSFMARLRKEQRQARSRDGVSFMEVEMIADPDTDVPRRLTWVDPLLIRSITHCPPAHLWKLENEMGYGGE